jgi:hypothetical protein
MSAFDGGNLRRNWWKIMIIAFAFSVIYALEHGALPSNNATVLPPSVIAESGLLPIVFILYGAIWFGLLACIFALIQHRLPGNKLTKGLVYGCFFFVIVFMIYFEPLPHSGSFGFEMTWMLADGVPLLLFGTLLGLFLAENQPKGNAYQIGKTRIAFSAILALTTAFFVGRIIDYTVIGIYSSFSVQMLRTLAWAFFFGLGIGILYFFLRPAIKQSSPIKTAVFFGVLMFGLYVLLFNFAFPLIVHMELLPIGSLTIVDLFIRVAIDSLFVTAAVFAYEYVATSQKSPQY